METIKEYLERRGVAVPKKLYDRVRWMREAGIPREVRCTRCGGYYPTMLMATDRHGKEICPVCAERMREHPYFAKIEEVEECRCGDFS